MKILKTKRIYFFFILVLSIINTSCDKPDSKSKEIHYFNLADVKLTPGPFYNALKLNESWLLSFDPDRLMSGFREESGLPKKASKYGGWESQGVAGQSFGHYLSACAMTYAASGNEQFLEKINYCIDELEVCQKAMNFNGLLASYPRAKELFHEIDSGYIYSQGFDLNGGWVPLYTTHKLLAGLIDVYKYTKNEKAYSVLIKLSDFFVNLFNKRSDEEIQKILYSEHGGLTESFSELYGLTGEQKYLKLASRLNHREILDPLIEGKDKLTGKHANTQSPKIVGSISEYKYTNDPKLFQLAQFYWNSTVKNRSYVIGGTCEAEHYGIPNRICDKITDKTCESCNTYNMLKLTKGLFMFNPTSDKSDYYERALYNHILPSQHPETGMVCYMSPMSTGSIKEYSSPFDSFWCCVGSSFESHSRYGEFIYFTDEEKNLFVNLFISNILNWKDRNIQIEQITSFPESDTISYTIKSKKDQKFSINLRKPGWAKNGFKVYINGNEYKNENLENYDGYICIDRKWKNNDKITYIIPQSFYSEEALGDESVRAYLYGPIVLTGKIDNKSEIPTVVVSNDFKIPLIDKSIDKDGKTIFKLKNSVPNPIEMYPYYKSKNNPIMIYIPHFTSEQWEKEKKIFQEKINYQDWLTKVTVSHFRPGEMQPERDHELTGINMENPGVLNGRKFRQAINGGEFSFNMDVNAYKSNEIMCTFWGQLGDVHKFDIIVESESVATVIIHWWGGCFFDKTYKIPESLTKNKDKVKVTFKAIGEKDVAGPLFECRIVSK